MSGQKAPGTVFVDDSVDTRAPTRSPDAPVSSGDIIGANATLTYQDMAGQPLQAKIDAYSPIINELDKRDTRSWAEKVFGQQYLTAATAGLPINTNKVWGDIARYRAADPNFLKDIPAKNDEEFDAWVKSGEVKKRTQAQDVVRREQGFGQQALGFGTGIAVGLVDPINVGGMLATGGIAGGAKTLLGSMAREAAINAAIETVELPVIARNRQQFGETLTPLEAIEDVGGAAIGGGILPAAGKLGRAVAAPALRPIGEAISPAFDPFRQRVAERALGIADLPGATDADVLRAFTDRVPPNARTPDTQAAINVLERETEVRGASPYADSPGGLDASAEKLGVVADALSRPASAGRAPVTPKPQGRTTLPLTQDRIIKFVLNDLEGGAAVVRYNQADGGTTKYGVAKKFNPEVDVANITEADAAAVARKKYWLPEFNTVDPRVASIAFDANWIRSPALARRIVREAGDDVGKALDIYRAELMHVADVVPGKGKYRKGWNNRVDKLARFVGDAEASTVKLAPEGFNGDDIAYRAATEDLNREELRLADDTPREPDPVRDFVDRQQAGEDLSAPEPMRFAANNADAISTELSRRAELGTDGHPDLTAARSAPEPMPTSAPSPTETALAVRQYVDRRMGEATPEAISRDLGIPHEDASKALAGALIDAPARAERLAAFDAATASLDTIKPTDQRTLWHVQVGDKMQVVSSLASARREVLSAARDTGDYDRIFDKVLKWDGRPRKFGGVEVKRLNEGQREIAQRQRIAAEPDVIEQAPAPPSLDPKTYGVDTPTDPQAKMLADSAYHDAKALADIIENTRGQGVLYHGSRGELPDLGEGYYNPANIYGGFDTFYTTDAVDIASGYRRKSGDGRIYEVTPREGLRVFDMEQRKPASDWEEVLGISNDTGDLRGTALDIVEGERGNPNLREIMDAMREYSRGEGYSRDDVQELFDAVITNLKDRNYDAMTHVGGLNTGREAHTVNIYFNAKDDLRFKDITDKVAVSNDGKPSSKDPGAASDSAKPEDPAGPSSESKSGPSGVDQGKPIVVVSAASDIEHLRELASLNDTLRVQSEDGGPDLTAKELVESLDRDQSAIDAIRNCL